MNAYSKLKAACKEYAKATKLLHAMAAELEGAFSSYCGDYCIEIPAKDAKALLRQYEKWRKSP
jgi:hypothetical protein